MPKAIEKFAGYLKVSDALLDQASKAETAEVARVLALHVGHYRIRYGDVPISESLELLATEKITDEMAATLASGFGALVEVLKALGSPSLCNALLGFISFSVLSLDLPTQLS
jgi:hypothetical protein